MENPQLFADRFLVTRDQRIIDLASGEDVALVTLPAGGPTEVRRWMMRCDWFFSMRHRAIAELVDYGMVGETRRFEAWRCGPPWRGAEEEGHRIRELARTFLRANGVSDEGRSPGDVRTSDARAVLLPGLATGHPVEPTSHSEPGSLDSLGLAIAERRAIAAIAELFEVPTCRPKVLGLGAAPGAGLDSARTALSRVARLNGFVPLSTRIGIDVPGLLKNRSLFILADGVEPHQAWARFLELTIQSPRGHVQLFVGCEPIANVHFVWLDRLTPEALAAVVRPARLCPPLRRRVESMAKRARGLPGRFADLLWGRIPAARRARHSVPSVVAAEHTQVYGDETMPLPCSTPLVERPSWPAPGELVALKGRMESAVALVKRGRHTPGERALRAVLASLARRRDWDTAVTAALALAQALLRRGRPRDAQHVLSEATSYARHAGLDGSMVDVAILSGTAWTDLARLEEAESVLSASLTAAISSGDAFRTAANRLALARCLFWAGRYEEAGRTLATGQDREMTDAAAIRRTVLLSRIAIGTRQLDVGVKRALGALEAAERAGDPPLVADAANGLAFAHLAVGDHVAVERDVAVGLRAARVARDPLVSLRTRLLAAEHHRRMGRPAGATALIARLKRLPAGSLPETIRARCALLRDLLSGVSVADAVRKQVAETGLGALGLFAPPQGATSPHDIRAAANDIVEILRLCQSADEDRGVPAAVCALLRARLRAAAVAFFVNDRDTLVPLVSDGSTRLEPEIAARAMAAGQVVAPHLRHDVLEGGAPVRFGGETIGALVARWTLGASHDLGHALLLFSSAATAAGPAIAAAIAHRSARQAGADEFLGVSAAMEDVRRSVERAAAAPFGVLIEGESGSGKELVARALHRRSPRRDRPFCTVNCAALPDELVESELFGHARGAFTGAIAERLGVFEEAHTGTLFLDEIGELSPRAQAKVLRTIQEGELRRVGENVARRIDVRIVSATNRDLRREVSAGRFRLDLLYRLDVVRISLPPLRERREDVAVLVARFWQEATARIGSRAVLSAAIVAALARYDWPGNVREVQNVLASLAVRSPRRGVIPPTALPPSFGVVQAEAAWRLDDARKAFEERFVRAALVRTGGHRARAADELGVTRQGLTKLMTRLGISE